MKLVKNQLRIIGGKWRGRKIIFPAIEGIRPTPNRIRETVFNWLSPIITDTTCLDLFAGSGTLGFEALSRGAKKVVFVDENKKAIEQIQINCQQLNCNNIETHYSNAEYFLNQTEQKFDIVFLDPPFKKNLVLKICAQLLEQNILNTNAYIYIETESDLKLLQLPENLKIIKEKQAGLVIYRLVKYKLDV